MRFSTVALLASILVSSFAASVAEVKADMANITSHFTALHASVQAFPTGIGGTLDQALLAQAIHNNFVSSIAAVDKGYFDAKVAPAFSETDGPEIIASLWEIKSAVESALAAMIVKAPAIVGVRNGVVMGDLRKLNPSFEAFGEALVTASSGMLSSQLRQVFDESYAMITEQAQELYALLE